MKFKLLVIAAVLALSACNKQNPLAGVEQSALNATQQQAKTAQQARQDQLNQQLSPTPPMNQPPTRETASKVILTTSRGEIELELYPDKAPATVTNFLDKAKSGHYNNLTFHRVEDWVVQGGDPLGNGTGGGKMTTELSDLPFKLGSLGVARGGDIKVSNDSQFFICTKDCSWLTGQYTNFGQVTSGMDIATSIQIGDKIESIKPL